MSGPIAVRQIKVINTQVTSVDHLDLSFDNPVLAGNSIGIFGSVNDSVTYSAIGDDENGAYAVADTIDVNSRRLISAYVQSIIAGTPVIELHFSAVNTQYFFAIAEIDNAAASAFDGHIAAVPPAVVAGTGTLSTGSGSSSTNASNPALLLAFGYMPIATLNPNAAFVPNGVFAGSAAHGGCFCLESLRVTTDGPQLATFNPGSNGPGAAMLMIFDEIASAVAANQAMTTAGAG